LRDDEHKARGLCLALFPIAFTEFVYLTGSVYNLLLSSEEGMAFRADINAHGVIAISRACDKSIAATTAYVYVMVLGMDVCFHNKCFSSEPADHTQPQSATQGVPWKLITWG
jgi:hypothetical protein